MPACCCRTSSLDSLVCINIFCGHWLPLIHVSSLRLRPAFFVFLQGWVILLMGVIDPSASVCIACWFHHPRISPFCLLPISIDSIVDIEHSIMVCVRALTLFCCSFSPRPWLHVLWSVSSISVVVGLMWISVCLFILSQAFRAAQGI